MTFVQTFDRLCEQARTTDAEREALAWHLACYRMRRTFDELRRPK